MPTATERLPLLLDCAPEWNSIARAHQNVIFEGPRDVTDAAVQFLMPYLAGQVVQRRTAAGLDLETVPCRTLILHDVDTLQADEQATLGLWLSHERERVQVVSTSTEPLFPLVARGLFNEALYYRLNVMRLQLRQASR